MKASVFLLFSFLLIHCGAPDPQLADQQEKTATAARVRVLELQPTVWRDTIRAQGVIESSKTVDLTLDFSATARKVHFRENEKVKRGAVLVTFDEKDRKLQLDQATSQLEEARAQYNLARETFHRRAELYETNTASLEEFRMAETRFRSARAALEQTLAAQALARHQLEKTSLISPVTGTVVKREIDAGETILPGQRIVRIQVDEGVRVICHITEKDINALTVGNEATLTSPGVRGRVYQARIESIGNEADPSTGNFPVRLAVANEGGLLRPGMTTRIHLHGLTYRDTLVVPRSAVVDRHRRRFVFKVEQDKAVAVEPVLAATLAEALPVLDGLQPGDRIIISGANAVSDGSPLDVLP